MSYQLLLPIEKSHIRTLWKGFWNGISFFKPVSYSVSYKGLDKQVQEIMNEIAKVEDTEELKRSFEEALIKTSNGLLEKKSFTKR
ncbi:hypothetical protein EDB95_0613 [Dinghuibacter silviterrae]|uniref:Uncharacterized protein n=1 Tax=Dinghuibacter silviterrae TaxID=1539049 RepID=A0A4R8DNL2_9BACT|nr:hypothetical protein EDB95_0613 [Dinghuibacter silviterrae]